MRRIVLAGVIAFAFVGVSTAQAGGGVEFGFLAGQRNYEAARFSRTSGDTSPSLTSAFRGAPFSGVTVAGAGVELSIAVKYLRFSVGYARPYVQFAGPIITHDPVTAMTTTAQIRSMEASETLFGLGYHRRLKRTALTLDLVGTISEVSTDIAIGERQGTYEASGFGFSVRGGVRHPIHQMFYLHASGEVGVTGSTQLGATFGIGTGIP